MLGSYSPDSEGETYTKDCDRTQSPSGVLARSGVYIVHSTVEDKYDKFAGWFVSH
jgi:RHO protein GDP dissociation inhibitor